MVNRPDDFSDGNVAWTTARYGWRLIPPSPSFTPTETPAPTVELGACTLEAVANLFCRAGSSSKFAVIDCFTPGRTAPIVGVGIEGLYWNVRGLFSGLTCTVSQGERYGIITGDRSTLPDFTPMPTRVDTPTAACMPTRSAFGG